MGDSGQFFRGTTIAQDGRFKDKEALLMKSMKFPPEFDTKVDMRKVELAVMKPWIAKKVVELLGFEDDVLIEYISGLLENDEDPMVDAKKLQLLLTGFLEKKTPIFMSALWNLLLSAQSNPLRVPTELLEEKKAEMRQREAGEAVRRREEESKGGALEDIRRRERDERGGGAPRPIPYPLPIPLEVLQSLPFEIVQSLSLSRPSSPTAGSTFALALPFAFAFAIPFALPFSHAQQGQGQQIRPSSSQERQSIPIPISFASRQGVVLASTRDDDDEPERKRRRDDDRPSDGKGKDEDANLKRRESELKEGLLRQKLVKSGLTIKGGAKPSTSE